MNVDSSDFGHKSFICADTKVTEVLQDCQSGKYYFPLSSSEIAGLVCYLQNQINNEIFVLRIWFA